MAYRDGVLAADTLTVIGDRRAGHVGKIGRLADGTLFGGSGQLAEVAAFLKWIHAGREGPCPIGKESCGLVIHPDGRIEAFEGDPAPCESFKVSAPFYARGSGAPIAIGAMAAGAAAEEAVRIATEYDIYTGGEITVLRR